MADKDIWEVYLIPTDQNSDCLVCSDTVEPLVALLHSGTVMLCLRHIVETTQRNDMVEGAHLTVVEG